MDTCTRAAIAALVSSGLHILSAVHSNLQKERRRSCVQALLRKGFSREEISFAFLLRDLAQSIHSGDVSNTRDPRLADAFQRWSKATAHDFGLEPISFEDFSRRYRATLGIDVENDSDLPAHAEPGTDSPVALLLQSDMVARDEHLLATIKEQLSLKRRVLVVYGGSHWTTLSSALKSRLGKPRIRSSFAEKP